MAEKGIKSSHLPVDDRISYLSLFLLISPLRRPGIGRVGSARLLVSERFRLVVGPSPLEHLQGASGSKLPDSVLL